MTAVSALAIAKRIARDKYAWPGGYALFGVMSDGELLCPACIRSEWKQIVRYTIWQQRNSGWMIEGFTHTGEMDIDEECPESCSHCNKPVSEF